MKTKNIVLALMLMVVIGACSKEEVTKFNDYDKNWLVMEDDPNDAVVHQSYLFYKDFGFPIYFNDTIGTQERVDVFGNTYTHYEVLLTSYSLGGATSSVASPTIYDMTLCSKSDVPAAIDFIRQEVMPLLPAGVHIPSILFVETLNNNAFKYAFKGFNTIVISNISEIPTMTDSVKKEYKGAILRACLTSLFLGGKYDDVFDKFADETRKYGTQKDLYNLYTWYLSYYVVGVPAPITAQSIGFLGPDPRNSYFTPGSPSMDASMYLESLLVHSSDEFNALYGTYDVIMKKAVYIKNIIRDMGIDIN